VYFIRTMHTSHRIMSCCLLCALDFAVLHVGCDGRVSRCTWNYYGFSICRGAQVIKLHVRSFSPALLSTVLFDRRLYGSSDILPGQMRGWTIQEHCAQLFQGYRVTESLEASSRPAQTAMDVNRWKIAVEAAMLQHGALMMIIIVNLHSSDGY